MEVLIPPPPPSMDFDFNSARSSPHTSAPSTPKRFGEYFFSAPTSPARMANFYREFEEFDEFGAETPDNNRSPSTTANVPFDWEEKPGTPKSPEGRTKKIAAKNMYENEEDGEDDLFDFAFDLRKADLERDSHSHRSAEELFDGGKIRPLRPPPRLHDQHATATLTATTTPKSPLLSPRSPKSQQQNSYYRGMFSPRRPKIENVDPFKVAVENSKKTAEQQRGRERLQGRSNSGRRATRSHSPYRVSAYRWEEEEQREEKQVSTAKQTTLSSSKSSFFTNFSSSLASASKGSSKRWRLKDLLLFRSASEGRATDKKDPLRKYSATGMFRKQEEAAAATNASFRSGDCPASSSSSSGSISKRRSRGGPVSAHELHYTVNRAVSEDLKKKTFLPYKQGILGRLAFNPAVHALANGFGSLYR